MLSKMRSPLVTDNVWRATGIFNCGLLHFLVMFKSCGYSISYVNFLCGDCYYCAPMDDA